MSTPRRPYSWAERLLRAVLPPGPRGESIRADLDHEYRGVEQERGASVARRWHAWEAVKLAAHFVWAARSREDARGGVRGMDGMGANVRLAIRRVKRTPGFAAMAIVTMALGIGANVAIFSVIDAVLLDPLPYHQSDELVALWEWHAPRDRHRNVANPGNVRAWDERSETFARMTAISLSQPMTVMASDVPDEVMAQYAQPTFFDLLGVEAEVGRTFVTEPAGGETPEALISVRYWREAFAADPGVVGRTITVNSRPVVVVGVVSEYVVFGEGTQVWVANPLTLGDQTNTGRYLMVIGRLAEGATLEAATAEMTSIGRGLEDEFPDFNAGWGVELVPLRAEVVGDVQQALWVLLGSVGLLLLIACANVANLFLVRATERQQEMAVRRSLGASGRDLSGQLLTESLVIASLGAALGVGLAHVGTRLLVQRIPDAFPVPRLEGAALDAPVLLFAVAVTVVTGLLFGLLPAAEAMRSSMAGTLSAEGRGPSRRTGRVRSGLVVAEVAVSAVLLVGATLFARSFSELMAEDPGIEPEAVLVGRVNLVSDRYSGPAPKTVFFESLISELAGDPDVAAVGGVTFLPMDGGGAATSFWPADRPAPPAEERDAADIRNVSGDYFGAMGIEVLQGRPFDSRDRADGPQTAVVNRTLADRFWPGESALGKSVVINWVDETPWEIVGVVEDVRLVGLDTEPRDVVYLHYAKAPFFPWLHLAVRGRTDAASLTGTLRSAVAEADPLLPIGSLRVMSDIVARSAATPRVTAVLMSIFAALATVLAAVGLYGVLAYAVSRRSREIGVRVALGARPADVLGMVVRQGSGLAVVGLGVGLGLALLAGRVLRGLLYQIAPHDPQAVLGAGAVLLLVASLACAIPAWRALRVAPVEALRSD